LICILNTNITYALHKQIKVIGGTSAKLQEDTLVVGDWSGTSICQIKNSGCQDEQAYYRITKTKTPLIYKVTGYKIVKNDSLNMGTLDFNYDKQSHSLSCTTQNGIFTFVITGKNMDGELRTHDKILGLAGITINTTPKLLTYQSKIFEAVKPYNKFTFKISSASIYHLDDYGTAQKRLWTSSVGERH
ncbi:MAG TPA: hypothetical protein VGZ90_19020, partial [Puia sp.]|nr:hypothetical protein [Puia sp.]